MMSVRWLLSSFCFFVFMVLLGGCTDKDVVKNGWKALSVSATTYNTVMESAGKLYKEGKLSEEKKEVLVNIGKIYTGAYKASVDALETYDRAITQDKSFADLEASKKAFKVSTEFLRTKLFDLIDNYNTVTAGIDGITKIQKPEVVDVK